MRIVAFLLLLLLLTGCTDYAYEEEYFLRVNGSGELRISGSEVVFPILHPQLKEINRDTLREHFNTSSLKLLSIQDSTQRDERYYHLRGHFNSWKSLCEHGAFAARVCSLAKVKDALTLQVIIWAVVAPMSEDISNRRLSFRFHIPSALLQHNTTKGVQHGNILNWEQTLEEHQTNSPLSIEVKFDDQSVFGMALQMLGIAIVLVLITIGVSLVIIYRKGRKQLAQEKSTP